MYFFREYQQRKNESEGQFDNLMLLYALNLQMVGKSMGND